MIATLPPPFDFSQYDGRPALSIAADPLTQYGGWVVPPAGVYTVQFHDKLAPLFVPSRYKILEGGRGGMKSWGIARALIVIMLQRKVRVLCAREHMASIDDSVYKLLKDQIEDMGLGPWFVVHKNGIQATNGSEVIFVGLGDMSRKGSRTKVKSFEGVDIVWVEEAETITKETWRKLIPTIRKKGSEIWISYNPDLEDDATYESFHVNVPPGATRIVMNWRDNLWISDELLAEKDHLYAVDAEAAAHVWDGELRKHAEATIMQGKYVVEDFETPAENVRFYHGVDWGFAQDPTAIVRCYITGEGQNAELWIDREAWGVGIDFATYQSNLTALCQDIRNPQSRPGLFEKIDTLKKWPIKADSARPETISYVRGIGGYNISAAEKWNGSVEDGITHLRGFKRIHIHRTNCPQTAAEFRLYKYKVDPMTDQVLPVIIDKHNHCIDALRYALDGFIQRRGAGSVWARMAKI